MIAKSEGRLCVQYVRRPDGLIATVQSRSKLHQIARGASRIAAGAFTATLSITGAAQQAFQPDNIGGSGVAYSAPTISPSGTLSGRVVDQTGAPITSATVGLFRGDSGLALYASTNGSGEYRFDLLSPGSYNLRTEAPEFAPDEVNGIYIQPNSARVVNQALRPQTLETKQETMEVVSFGGAIAIVAPRDPLIRAAQQDDMEEVVRLVAGANLNLRDKTSRTTALEHAVRNANREMVQLLIAGGADVNLQNESGESVLMMLDNDATSDLVWDLINAGAKVNAVDKAGNTPLIEAASCDNVDVLKTLLDAGAQIQTRNDQYRER